MWRQIGEATVWHSTSNPGTTQSYPSWIWSDFEKDLNWPFLVRKYTRAMIFTSESNLHLHTCNWPLEWFSVHLWPNLQLSNYNHERSSYLNAFEMERPDFHKDDDDDEAENDALHLRTDWVLPKCVRTRLKWGPSPRGVHSLDSWLHLPISENGQSSLGGWDEGAVGWWRIRLGSVVKLGRSKPPQKRLTLRTNDQKQRILRFNLGRGLGEYPAMFC